jgi:hypothetical protein
VIIQFPDSSSTNRISGTAKLSKLARMSGKPVTIPPGKVTSFFQKIRAILERITVFLV